jgi:membrane protease YdiL (CAAX protease family)
MITSSHNTAALIFLCMDAPASRRGTAYHSREMRSAKYWIPAFVVLFVCYQAPEGFRMPLLMLAFLPIAWLVARALGLGMGSAYALEWNRGAALYLAVGFALTVLAKLVALWIGTSIGIYTFVPGHLPPAEIFEGLAWIALSTFVPSIAEDILTRGFWARVPAWQWTAWRFVLFTSVAYVLNHIYRLGNGPTEWLMLSCFGLAYATALWRTGSLWAAVGLHWGWNFAGSALGPWWNVAQPGSGWWLSAAAHLLLAALCLLLISPASGVSDPRGSSRAPAAGT